MDPVPQQFAQRMAELFGERGDEWIKNLPGLVEACANRWGLTVGAPFDLSYNYVAPAVRRDGSEVVLKVGVPHPELKTEIAAMRIYDGRGIARLLEADAEAGAMLLERLRPGLMLREMLTDAASDERATRIAAGIMRDLWKPLPAEHSFPDTARWASGMERLRTNYDGGTGPFPARLVEEAEALFRNLLASSGEIVLLHGDLHHDNILSTERAPWLALDPKGLAGEREYEIGAFLRNPSPWLLDQPDPVATTARRIAILAEELGMDRQRLRDWNQAQAVLSAWWTVEDHGALKPESLRTAAVMAEVRV